MMTPKREPVSQKARGVLALYEVGVKHYGVRVPPALFILDEADLDELEKGNFIPTIKEDENPTWFGRPCPEVACHGFVDSRPVRSASDVRELFKEARAADARAEVLVMKYIEAKYNAIWTPNTLTVGPGNDGATSGKNCVVVSITTPPMFRFAPLYNKSGVTDTPYVELVYGEPMTNRHHQEDLTNIVQVRNGPAVPSMTDFIPAEMKVEHVEVARGDLLEWRDICKEFKPGTVVYHPGGSLASHYAVHCVTNNIPCIITWEPKVGETLKPIEGITPGVRPIAFTHGIEAGVLAPWTYQEALYVMLFGLHNYTVNQGRVGSRMIGLAVTACLRLSIAACLGEMRHKQRGRRHMDRTQVFAETWDDLFAAKAKMSSAYKSFALSHWKHGYGGKAWASCAEETLKLWDCAVAMCKDPTVNNANACIEQLNQAVNVAHNNGWMFNKFTTGHGVDIMNEAASSDEYFFMRAGPGIYKGMTQPDAATDFRKMRKSRILRSVEAKVKEKYGEKHAKKVAFPATQHVPPPVSNQDNNEGFIHGLPNPATVADMWKPKEKKVITSIQIAVRTSGEAHVQFRVAHSGGGYSRRDVPISSEVEARDQGLRPQRAVHGPYLPYVRGLCGDPGWVHCREGFRQEAVHDLGEPGQHRVQRRRRGRYR